MGKLRGLNQKAAAAAEQKLANQKVKDAAAAATAEKQAGVEWSKGANLRGQQKMEAAALKADEQARKKREKAVLLAEEEANTGSSKPKKAPTLSNKGKKKNNDLSLLEDALVGAADKKVKSKRAAERQKAEKQKTEEARKRAEQKPVDPLLANTQSMILGTEDEMVGRAANKALEVEGAGGIDNALNALNTGSAATSEPTKKALYKAFEERKMAELKSELPGLKMSQYKDKVFNLWKKSPENPKNQQ
ncbi:unnamed protein product [Cylindrotheca closterium]|uniref:Uncharacterized protein n=1 Tax=Cylindrotheca closterium TaxID=2856 RepID=A0AAD2FTS8_9STRA|nr:unnamed protein product [Cylindrotheca closterium]